jgi:hypothetical protein
MIERVRVTVAFDIDIDMDYYPNTVLSPAEAVAFDVLEDEVEALMSYLGTMDNLAVVSVTEVIDEKNDTALLAERLSKELSSE